MNTYDYLPGSAITVELTEDDITRASTDAVAIESSELKQTEYTENNHLANRFTTGNMGELAVEKYTGYRCHDSAITTRAASNHADCMALNAGIKTFKYRGLSNPDNRWCIDTERNREPQILAVIGSQPNNVHILGVASPELLRKWGKESETFELNTNKKKISIYNSHVTELTNINEWIKGIKSNEEINRD